MVVSPISRLQPRPSDPYEDERRRVITAARRWIGTPFADNACVLGAGVDCAQFIRSAFEEAGIESPVPIEPYAAQWYLHGDKELWLGTVLDRGVEITEGQARAADLVLYKFGKFFAHGALITERGWPNIIHAYRQSRGVLEDLGDQGFLKGRDRRFFTRKAWAA